LIKAPDAWQRWLRWPRKRAKRSGSVAELIEGVDFEDENYGVEILKRELQRDQKVDLWWD
jgi:hypothetical protein